MTKAKILVCAALSTMVMLVSLSGTVCGITGNFASNSSPYVGLIVLYSDADLTTPIGYCSGVLISPTIMLTAGHATIQAKAVKVCFDKGPISYDIENGKLIYPPNEKIYTGTPLTYKEYIKSVMSGQDFGAHLFESSDIGLIRLDSEVEGVTKFPTLPDVGFANKLPSKTFLNEIGYGVQYQTTPRNGGIKNSWTGILSCNSAQAQLIPGNFAGSDKYLRLTANPGQDKGGVAFGDSGGPVLYHADKDTYIVLAINAYVSNSNCAGVSYHTRIDTRQVLDWIHNIIGV